MLRNLGFMLMTLAVSAWIVTDAPAKAYPGPDTYKARAGKKGSAGSEQLHFSAEDDTVKEPVAIPQDVLAILRNDKFVRDVLEEENIPAEKIPRSWFSASAIHLRNPDQTDLVVMSVGPVHGANVTMFWVFRGTAHGYDLVLNTGGHDLEMKSTRWKGYREIESMSVTMQKVSTVSYRFDGKRYTKYKDTLENIR